MGLLGYTEEYVSFAEDCSMDGDVSMDLNSLTLDDIIAGDMTAGYPDTENMHVQYAIMLRDENPRFANIVNDRTRVQIGQTTQPGVFMERGNDTIRHLSSSTSLPTNIPVGYLDVGDVFSQDKDGDTKLHMAIIHRHVPMAETVIKMAPDPSFLDLSNALLQTPLHLAALTRQGEMIRMLMRAGATVDYLDIHGNTPLHVACRGGFEEIVECILQSSFSDSNRWPDVLNRRNYDGLTCLHLATKASNLQMIKALLENGADINIGDALSGRTVLHYAVETGNRTLLYFLLQQRNVDVCCQTYGGLTPLLLATGRNYEDIVKALIASGAFEDDVWDDR